MKLQLTPQAVADLQEIAVYIAAENPRAANAVVDTIERRLRRLVQHPHIGIPSEDIGPDIRRLVMGQYLAFYTVAASTVRVLRVLHGKRRIDSDMMS